MLTTTTIQPQRHFYVGRDMDAPKLHSVQCGKVVALCRRCPEKTEPNDDSAAVVQTESGAIVLMVADGVGGCPSGHKASAIAVKSVARLVRAAAPGSDLRPAILDGIERANQQILRMGVGAATTLAIVEIQANRARGYQVGDSMTMILGQRGALKWKSTPHSPVGYAVESGLLDEVEAMHHDQRHVVSNFVGSREMHIEIGPACQLTPRDTVVLGSDGLFDNLQIEEVIEHGRRGKPIDRINGLVDLASARMIDNDGASLGKPDDLTILLYTP